MIKSLHDPGDLGKLIYWSKQIPVDRFRELYSCMKYDRVIRLEAFSKRVNRIQKQIIELKLNCAVSKNSFKVILDKNLGNWGSSIEPCADLDPNAMKFLYVNRDHGVCEIAKTYDEKNDDVSFGLHLNYPKCCVEAYQRWQKGGKDIDPISILFEQNNFQKETFLYNFPNPFTRYFACGLFSHFPCSLQCDRTKNDAKRCLEGLLADCPSVGKRLLQMENSLIVFKKNVGICLWTSYTLENSRIVLKKSSFRGMGELRCHFSRVDEILISKQELILVRNGQKSSRFSTEDIFCGAFSFN